MCPSHFRFSFFLWILASSLYWSCSSGGGQEEQLAPPASTGDLVVFFRLHVGSVALACAADPLCHCSTGQCGQANVEVSVQGAVTQTHNPFLPFGPGELGSGVLEDDGTEFSDLPTGGYIVTVRRRVGYPSDLNTRSVTSGVPHFIYFNLGLPVTFPLTIADGSTTSVLVETSTSQALPLLLPPLALDPSGGEVPSGQELTVRVRPSGR